MIRNPITGQKYHRPILRYLRDATDGISRPSAIPPTGFSYEPVPPSLTGARERDVYFLSGRSGSGKSYLSAGLLAFYRGCGKRIFVITDIPDPKFGPTATYLDINTLVGISATYEEQKRKYDEAKIKFKHRKKHLENEDDVIALEIALNKMKPEGQAKRKMELRFSQDQLDKLFSDAVVLFDDYENNTDAKLIGYLRDHLLTKGRHSKTSLIICNHLTNFGPGSRLIMAETTNFVLFKKNTAKSRSYFLKEYLEFTTEQIKIAQNAMKTSRWLAIDRDLDISLSQDAAWRD